MAMRAGAAIAVAVNPATLTIRESANRELAVRIPLAIFSTPTLNVYPAGARPVPASVLRSRRFVIDGRGLKIVVG